MIHEAVILDPYHPYAALLIERLFHSHRVRTICLHSNWLTRLKLEGRHSVLRSPAVTAHYPMSMGLGQLVKRLQSHHHVVGVLPHEEGTVLPLAQLAEALGLSWAAPDVLPAFRDKVRLKALIRANDPTVRMNRFAAVSDASEALEFAAAAGLQRFVLKPNDGSGNTDVAFFDADADRRTVQEYFTGRGRHAVLLEEFIAGPEYYVNGQTDEHGEPTVVGVGRYLRIHENGKENQDAGGVSVAGTDPAFEPLRQYAQQVIRATGLRRSPFHLEAIMDERGPCLVEVAARFCGEMVTLAEMWQHGPQLDLFDLAAHHYISDGPYGPVPLDWDRHGRRVAGQVAGGSPKPMRLVRVDGLAEVERSPAFLFWNKKPAVGDFVHRKVSVTTSAWSATLRGQSTDDVLRAIHWTRATVRLHGDADGRWTLREQIPMYKGIANKLLATRPRPQQFLAIAGR